MKRGDPRSAEDIALLDVGSNAVRFVLARVRRDRGFKILEEGRVQTRLAGPGHTPSDVTLDQVMTRTPVALKRHDCITYAINCMATRNVRNVPVVDDENRPVGLLRVWDVIAHLSDVFEEIAQLPPESATDDMWLDLGGG